MSSGGIKINSSKSKEIIVSCSKTFFTEHPSVSINEALINQADHRKLLGGILDS